jgi:hypothetical protein
MNDIATKDERLLIWKRSVLPNATVVMNAYDKAMACPEGQAIIRRHRIIGIRALRVATPSEFIEKVRRYYALFKDLGIKCPPWTEPP